MGKKGGEPTSDAGRTIGRYVIYDELASGGMAAVHFGRLSGPVGFSRPVAIKRLHPHLAKDPEFVTMFLDEARLAARVRHPNVVPTLDVVAMDTEVFIVMEYVQGEAVSRLVRAQRARSVPMPIPYALAILAGALNGLHAAHEARDEHGKPLGLVHRDVSPQNILVGADGVTRVLDFGVAKAAGRLQDTRDGALKGKVAYMSPEQLVGQDVTRRSDIYSACVVLWELLAGRRLYLSDGEPEIVAKILGRSSDPRLDPPSVHNAQVSPALDAIVLRGLAVAPEDRFPTARELAQLLEKNGGLIAASELGDWVESLASEVLSKRAARVHAIEAGNTPSQAVVAAELAAATPPPQSESEPPSTVPEFARDAETQVNDANTDVGLSIARHQVAKSRRRRVAASVALLVLVGLGIFGLVALRDGRFGGSTTQPRAAAGERPSATSSSPAALVSEPAIPSAIPSASAAGTLAVVDASPAKTTAAAASTSVRRPPPVVRPPPKADECDPPYIIDGEGHKVYKRNCLK